MPLLSTTASEVCFPTRNCGRKYDLDKTEAQYNQALSIIKEKLPLIMTINIHPSKPDIIIDARGGAVKLLDSTEEKEDCRVNTRSIYIIEF